MTMERTYILPQVLFFCIGSFCLGYFIGLIWAGFSNLAGLHNVGIDRIEFCHNAHSNWYEIVWMEDKK